GTETNLIAYWNFEESIGTGIEDVSINNNSGIIQNGDGDEFAANSLLYAVVLDEDTNISLRLGGSDLDDQSSITAIVTGLPANGKLYLTNDGTTKGTQLTATPVTLSGAKPGRVIYEPNPNYYGTDAFGYQVSDGVQNSTNTTTVNLTINNVIDVPAIQASSISFSNVSATTGIDISWTNGDGTKRVVFVLEGDAGSAAPVDNTTYTADTVFGSGTQIGTSGWYAVYNGTDTSVSVTGLAPGKTYRVIVMEYAILGSESAYNTSSTSGNTANVIIPKLDQSITLATSDTKTYGDADFDPGATSDASLTVTYESSDTNIATIVSGKVHIAAAGQVTITAKQAGNGTYNAAPDKSQTLTINKKQLTASLTGSATKVYDGTSAATLTSSNYLLSGVVGSESIALNNPASGTFDSQDVGTAKTVSVTGLAISGSNASNYALSSASASAAIGSITQKQLTASLTGSVTKVYDGASAATLASSNYLLSGVVGTDAVSLNNPASGTFDSQDVGTAKTVSVTGLAISGSNASNYALSSASASAAIGSITQKAITVTADGKSKTYGTADPALTYTFTPALEGSDAFSGSLSRAAGETTGTYAISQGSVALSTNYTIGFTPANFIINKAPLSIIADQLVKFQGQPNPTLTYTYSGFVNNETSTVLTSHPTASTVATQTSSSGAYPIVLSGAAATNYAISYVNKTLTVVAGQVLTINFAASTVLENSPTGTTAGTLTSTSDDPASQFSYTLVSGSGDTDNSLFSISGDKINVAANLDFENKANYSVRVRSTTLYNQTLEKTFTITINNVNEQPAIQASGITFTNISNSTGMDISWINGDGSQRVVFVYEGNTGSAAPIDNTNYTANTIFGSGTQIGTSGWYTVFNGTGTSVSVTGLEPGKTYQVMIVEYTILGSETAYNSSSTNGNTGNVTMPKLNQSITLAASNTKTYGDADFDPGATSDASLAVTYQSSDTNIASIVSGKVHIVAAGQVSITAQQAGNSTYNAADKVQTLTINKKQLTASLTGSVSKTFDGTTAAALTTSNYILTGVVGTESITLNNPTAGTFDTKDQGTGKTVSVSGLSVSGVTASNYDLSSTTASAAIGSISQKAVAISAEAKSKTFGDADPSLTYTFTPALAGSDAFSGSLTRTAGENTGTYLISQGSLGLSTNYTISFTPANLTINKAPLTITADDLVKFQGQPNPTLTYSYSGFVNNETNTVLTSQPVASTEANEASSPGTYSITLSGAAANNYAIAYLNKTLTVVAGQVLSINLAALTVLENSPTGTTAGTLTSTSDDPASQFTYSLISGTGDTDNSLFSISGNQITVAANLDFENKANYSVRVRSTNQYNQSLEKTFTITINDVNEQPTLNSISNQTICYSPGQESVALSGITAGPEGGQSTKISVTCTNSSIFEKLEVIQASSSGNALIKYKLANRAFGNAVINIEVKDNGGTTNSGNNTITKSFNLNVNTLPELTIKSDKADVLSKGEVATLKGEVTTGNDGLIYTWANAEGILSGKNTNTLTVRPQETTTYHLTVTNAQGCNIEKEITVAVNADFLVVNGTNILTPNGDGVNDRLVIRNLDMYPNNEVKIFDRAGRLLLNKKNYGNDWDGSLNGVFLTEDTYYYVVDFGPGITKIKGFVSILKD
ncbi:MAG TPA: MBG domain-containing protein, partial [Pedobacter sp.]